MSSATLPTKVLVIGGGIGGLTLVHSLQREQRKVGSKNFEITLVDKGTELGGWVGTLEHPYLLEVGPRAISLKKSKGLGSKEDHMRTLILNLGLKNDLLYPGKFAQFKYIFDGMKLQNVTKLEKSNPVIHHVFNSIVKYALKRSTGLYSANRLTHGDSVLRSIQRDSVMYGYDVDKMGGSVNQGENTLTHVLEKHTYKEEFKKEAMYFLLVDFVDTTLAGEEELVHVDTCIVPLEENVPESKEKSTKDHHPWKHSFISDRLSGLLGGKGQACTGAVITRVLTGRKGLYDGIQPQSLLLSIKIKNTHIYEPEKGYIQDNLGNITTVDSNNTENIRKMLNLPEDVIIESVEVIKNDKDSNINTKDSNSNTTENIDKNDSSTSVLTHSKNYSVFLNSATILSRHPVFGFTPRSDLTMNETKKRMISAETLEPEYVVVTKSATTNAYHGRVQVRKSQADLQAVAKNRRDGKDWSGIVQLLGKVGKQLELDYYTTRGQQVPSEWTSPPANTSHWEVLNEYEIPDESIGSFFSRSFSPAFAATMVDPMVAGIYAGDVNKLSMSSCFPDQVRKEVETSPHRPVFSVFKDVRVYRLAMYQGVVSLVLQVIDLFGQRGQKWLKKFQFLEQQDANKKKEELKDKDPNLFQHGMYKVIRKEDRFSAMKQKLHQFVSTSHPAYGNPLLSVFHEGSLLVKYQLRSMRKRADLVSFVGGMRTLPRTLAASIKQNRTVVRDGLLNQDNRGIFQNHAVGVDNTGEIRTSVFQDSEVLALRCHADAYIKELHELIGKSVEEDVLDNGSTEFTNYDEDVLNDEYIYKDTTMTKDRQAEYELRDQRFEGKKQVLSPTTLRLQEELVVKQQITARIKKPKVQSQIVVAGDNQTTNGHIPPVYEEVEETYDYVFSTVNSKQLAQVLSSSVGNTIVEPFDYGFQSVLQRNMSAAEAIWQESMPKDQLQFDEECVTTDPVHASPHLTKVVSKQVTKIRNANPAFATNSTNNKNNNNIHTEEEEHRGAIYRAYSQRHRGVEYTPLVEYAVNNKIIHPSTFDYSSLHEYLNRESPSNPTDSILHEVCSTLHDVPHSSMWVCNFVYDAVSLQPEDRTRGFGFLVPSHLVKHTNGPNSPQRSLEEQRGHPLYGLLGCCFDSDIFPDMHIDKIIASSKTLPEMRNHDREVNKHDKVQTAFLTKESDPVLEIVQDQEYKETETATLLRGMLTERHNPVILTVMLGGDRFPDLKYASHHEVEEKALYALEHTMNIKIPPSYLRVGLQTECLPQAYVGHNAQMRAIQTDISSSFGTAVRSKTNQTHVMYNTPIDAYVHRYEHATGHMHPKQKVLGTSTGNPAVKDVCSDSMVAALHFARHADL